MAVCESITDGEFREIILFFVFRKKSITLASCQKKYTPFVLHDEKNKAISKIISCDDDVFTMMTVNFVQ
jgi:hypothetical protein